MYKIILFLIGLNIFLFSSDRFDLPFDKSKLENYDEKKDMHGYIGIVTNQVWIYSKTLSKNNLEKKVLLLGRFKIIGYDKTYGVLVEYDENDISLVNTIDKMKNMDEIDNIFHRVYRGKEAFKPMQFNLNNF